MALSLASLPRRDREKMAVAVSRSFMGPTTHLIQDALARINRLYLSGSGVQTLAFVLVKVERGQLQVQRHDKCLDRFDPHLHLLDNSIGSLVNILRLFRTVCLDLSSLVKRPGVSSAQERAELLEAVNLHVGNIPLPDAVVDYLLANLEDLLPARVAQGCPPAYTMALVQAQFAVLPPHAFFAPGVASVAMSEGLVDGVDVFNKVAAGRDGTGRAELVANAATNPQGRALFVERDAKGKVKMARILFVKGTLVATEAGVNEPASRTRLAALFPTPASAAHAFDVLRARKQAFDQGLAPMAPVYMPFEAGALVAKQIQALQRVSDSPSTLEQLHKALRKTSQQAQLCPLFEEQPKIHQAFEDEVSRFGSGLKTVLDAASALLFGELCFGRVDCDELRTMLKSAANHGAEFKVETATGVHAVNKLKKLEDKKFPTLGALYAVTPVLGAGFTENPSRDAAFTSCLPTYLVTVAVPLNTGVEYLSFLTVCLNAPEVCTSPTFPSHWRDSPTVAYAVERASAVFFHAPASPALGARRAGGDPSLPDAEPDGNEKALKDGLCSYEYFLAQVVRGRFDLAVWNCRAVVAELRGLYLQNMKQTEEPSETLASLELFERALFAIIQPKMLELRELPRGRNGELGPFAEKNGTHKKALLKAVEMLLADSLKTVKEDLDEHAQKFCVSLKTLVQKAGRGAARAKSPDEVLAKIRQEPKKGCGLNLLVAFGLASAEEGPAPTQSTIRMLADGSGVKEMPVLVNGGRELPFAQMDAAFDRNRPSTRQHILGQLPVDTIPKIAYYNKRDVRQPPSVASLRASLQLLNDAILAVNTRLLGELRPGVSVEDAVRACAVRETHSDRLMAGFFSNRSVTAGRFLEASDDEEDEGQAPMDRLMASLLPAHQLVAAEAMQEVETAAAPPAKATVKRGRAARAVDQDDEEGEAPKPKRQREPKPKGPKAKASRELKPVKEPKAKPSRQPKPAKEPKAKAPPKAKPHAAAAPSARPGRGLDWSESEPDEPTGEAPARVAAGPGPATQAPDFDSDEDAEDFLRGVAAG